MDKLLNKLHIARKNSQEKHMSFAYIDGDVSITWDEIIDCISQHCMENEDTEPVNAKIDNHPVVFHENGYKKY